MKSILQWVVFALACCALPAAAQEYRIGWIGPLTGNAAALGVDALASVQLAIEEERVPGVNLIIEDDQMITANTIRSYVKLYDQGVRIFFIYSYSGLFALSPKSERAGVFIIDPLDCDEDIAALPAHIVCIAKRTEDFGVRIAEEIAVRNAEPAGVLYYENDAFPLKTATALRDALERLGKRTALFEGYQRDTTDFKPLLLQAKNKQLKSLAILGYTEVGPALRQAHLLSVNADIHALATVISPEIKGAAGEGAEGVFFPNFVASRTPQFAAYLAKFKDKTGRHPLLEVSSTTSYDAAKVLLKALQRKPAESGAPAEASKEFYALKDYPGVSGTLTLDPDGITRSLSVIMQRYRNGNVENITH